MAAAMPEIKISSQDWQRVINGEGSVEDKGRLLYEMLKTAFTSASIKGFPQANFELYRTAIQDQIRIALSPSVSSSFQSTTVFAPALVDPVEEVLNSIRTFFADHSIRVELKSDSVPVVPASSCSCLGL